MFYEQGSSFLQQRQQLNITAPVFGASSLYSDQLIALAGTAVDGLMLSSNFVPTNPDPKVQAFVGEYNKRFGVLPNQFAAQAYDAVGIMLAALKAAGPGASRDSLRAALAPWGDRADIVRSRNPRTGQDGNPYDGVRRQIPGRSIAQSFILHPRASGDSKRKIITNLDSHPGIPGTTRPLRRNVNAGHIFYSADRQWA
jgi:hypothetical protein